MARIGPVMQYNKMLSLVSSMVKRPVNMKMEELRLDFHTYKHYLNWVDKLVQIAVEHGTDSPEWRSEVERAAPKFHDPALARECARLAAEAFNVWKVRLPPRPEIVA